MIEGLKPYAEYKDSGLPWLGDIPKHWEVRRCKSVFNCIDVRSKAGEEELLTVSSKDGVVPRREKAVTMFMAESYEGYKLCWPRDLVINSLWAWAGGLGFSRHHGIISSAYGVYRSFEEFSNHWEYFDYLLRSKIYDWEFHVRSKGIWISRLQLTDESFLDMPIVLPPNDEATYIAQFLTGASARISRLIRAKRRLIELLNEQKQAIIHQAVTRGLDPNVRLKPSGIEWLGDVPEHWERRRLKQVVTPIEQGWSPQCDAQPAGEEEWGVLKVGCVNSDLFDVSKNKKLPPSLEPRPELEVKDGDILISRANTRELVGLAALAVNPRKKLLLCDKLFRFRAKSNWVDPRFLILAIRCPQSRDQIESRTNGASDSMQNIGQAVIRNLHLAVPPLAEQIQVVEKLFTLTEGLTRAIIRANREIDLLSEYRTRLISDVVTGKLDVRSVELPALDEDTEAEELIENEEVPYDD